MDNINLQHLDPDQFEIDDRKLEDLILYSLTIANSYKFFDDDGNSRSNWGELLKNDESFLLAKISEFDILYYDKLRLNLIKDFDTFSTQDDKEAIFSNFFTLLQTLFAILNKWYINATENNLKNKASIIEIELQQAIEVGLQKYFKVFLAYYLHLKNNEEYELNLSLDIESYASIWKADTVNPINIFDDIDPTVSPLSSALKKIIILYNPVYSVLYTIKRKSKKLFKESIENQDNHKSHVGLLMTFLHLYDYVKGDLNLISKQHLQLYYNNILQQSPRKIVPKKMFLTVQIDQNERLVNMERGQNVITGQNEEGVEILYSTNEPVSLNNIQISHLTTNFVSRNINYEFSSRFKLVSGIYTKSHCLDASEVEEFNDNDLTFSTFGEDQTFKSSQYQTMQDTEIGFAVASSVLVMSRSNREIEFNFCFSADSIKYLSNLIIDISNNKNLSEEKIFDDIFSDAFLIKYTNEEAWVEVKEYRVSYPEDWSLGEIRLSLTIDKKYPTIDNYDEEIHEAKLAADAPVFYFKLNTDNFYFAYSFLYEMELSKIDIDVKVQNLKNISVINNSGELDVNSEFEILGSTPKVGDSVLIGSNELFCKKLDKLGVGWEYTNLPIGYESLEDYFKEYDRDIKDSDYQIELSALSDFRFDRNGVKNFLVDMFELDDEGNITKGRNIRKLDVEKLKLKPNYELSFEDLKNYSNDLETGFLKLELMGPSSGFGFDIYTTVYNEAVAKATAKSLKSKKPDVDIITPQDPFAPMVNNLYFDYTASTSLFFEQTLVSQNDYDENNGFFLISSNGVQHTFSKEGINNLNLVPHFPFEGEIIIGLQNVTAPQNLSILFEIQKSENTDYNFSQKLEWQYLSFNGWKNFRPTEIINDGTLNLIRSGIITLTIPQDIKKESELFDDSEAFYIKASSSKKADQFSLIKSIHTNAVLATEVIVDDSIQETQHLIKGSAESFQDSIEGVLGVNQPMNSFSGSNQESEMEFFYRVSELLRHKNRPVTKRDFEKFTLIRFRWLSYVNCFFEKNTENTNERINVRLLCIKKIASGQNIEEVKLSQADMIEIKEYISKFTSPFVNIEIINPVFEDIWVKAKIKFLNISDGAAVSRLNRDLFHYICPWVKPDVKQINLSNTIRKSEIFNYIKSLPYIEFITAFSIVHIKNTEDGLKVAYDSASNQTNKESITIGTSRSILVPRECNIEILDNNEYALPEPVNFNELRIEGEFIITSKEATNDFDNQEVPSKENLSDTTSVSFNIKI